MVAVAAVYLVTASYGPPVANDPAAAAAGGWNLGARGAVEVPVGWGGRTDVWVVPGVDEAHHVDRFPGLLVWLAPGYAVASWLGESRAAVGDDPLAVSSVPATLTAALTAAAAIAVLLQVFRRIVPTGTAVRASLVVAFATPLWSLAADAPWPHALTALLVAVSLWAAERPMAGWWAGAAAGLGVLTRPHLGLAQLVLGVGAVWRGCWRHAAGPVLGVLAGVALLVGYTAMTFGAAGLQAGYDPQPLVGRLVSLDPSFTLTQAYGAWFHPTRGVLVLTPVLFVLLPWVATAWRSSPPWVRAGAIGGALYLLVQYRLMPWSGGSGFFGYRTSIEGLLLASPLLLRCWADGAATRKWWRRAGVVAVVAGVAIHGYGAVIGVRPPGG